MRHLSNFIDRKTKLLVVIFGAMFILPLLFMSKPVKYVQLVLPINSATMPPCVNDLTKLPIFLITANMREGENFRGTAFLIDDTHWVTAAHVVAGDLEELEIHTPRGKLSAEIEHIDLDNDIAFMTTRQLKGYEPIDIRYEEHLLFDDIWNVGYPGWAGMNEVISSGKVFGHSSIGMLYTSAIVMQGMSGGPTLSCNGPTVEVSSVISMFAKELFSETDVIIDGVATVEKVYINTGDSFSARLNQTDHIKSLQESKTYVTISHK